MEIDLPLCTFRELNTKYSCNECWIVVCNVCAVSVESNYSGYDEELKKVGVCKNFSRAKRKSTKKGICSMFRKQTVSKNNLIK